MFEYGFDLNNNLTKHAVLTKHGSNVTQYTYGKENLPATATFSNGKVLTHSYNTVSQTKGFTLNTIKPISVAYNYKRWNLTDDDKTYDNITDLIETEIGGGFAFRYIYDSYNNITEIYDNVKSYEDKSEDALAQTYKYDYLNQLTEAVDYRDNKKYVYTYDGAGNILSEVVTENDTGDEISSKTFTYDTESGWGDLLVGYTEKTNNNDSTINHEIKYTESETDVCIGNPIKYRDGIIFSWSNGRQLDSYTKDGKTVSYTYDTDGMRLSKTVGDVEYTYLYEGGLLVQETRGSKIFDYSYDANGNIRMLKYTANANVTPTYYYYALNSRGDVIGLYDSNGNLTARYTYDAWGNEVSVTYSNGNIITHDTHIAKMQPFRYRSYYYDTDSGFYYLQSRYYDPVTHRFINADGLVSTGTGILGHNMFAYCENNPIIYSDVNGEKIYFAGFVGPIQQGDYRIGDSWNKTSSSTSKNSSAPTYVESKGGPSNISPNCYSYAIGIYDRAYDPGMFSNQSFDTNLESVGNAFVSDMNSLGRGIRRINNYNSMVYEGEYRVALRVKNNPVEKGFSVFKTIDWDHHFMVETNSGRWAEKPSYSGDSILHPIGHTPETINWKRGSKYNYYDSPIIYYAITN